MRTETETALGGGAALVHVQVRTADCGGGDLDETVVWVLDRGERPLFDGDFEGLWGGSVSCVRSEMKLGGGRSSDWTYLCRPRISSSECECETW
jgi:hypothetical protein